MERAELLLTSLATIMRLLKLLGSGVADPTDLPSFGSCQYAVTSLIEQKEEKVSQLVIRDLFVALTIYAKLLAIYLLHMVTVGLLEI